MTSIPTHTAAATSQLPATLPPRNVATSARASAKATPTAEDVRQHFTQFVGEAFFGQMIKAMRAMTDKPAYFHGGRGEEVFQGQLDQKLAEHLTDASAERFAEPMFKRQFPSLTRELESSSLQALSQLQRR